MITYNPIIQKLHSGLFNERNLSFEVLRLDLLDPEISGNKWFKLKRNIQKAKSENFKTIITFGGAFSNHIAATAASCKLDGLNSVGVIRGDETQDLNTTLLKAKENGMLLHFVSREIYSHKTEESFKSELIKIFGEHYLIPEGGNNEEGILGCTEILKPEWDHDIIFCACGTAATFAGILGSLKPKQLLVGISVLKGENTLVNDALNQMHSVFPQQKFSVKGNEALSKDEIVENCISNNYCFNGYAKMDKQLVAFKNIFEKDFDIPLDYIYTNKLFYAVFDLMKHNKIKENSKILIIHCGGLQGNKGFEKRYNLE